MQLETRALLIPEKGLLKSLSEFTGLGAVILDQNFTILQISKEIKSLLKYEESELINRDCLSLCREKSRALFRLFLTDLNHEGVSGDQVWPLEPKSGRYIPCLVKGMSLETSSGEPLYLLSVTDTGMEALDAEDLQTETESCQVREKALHSSEERYRNLFEMCPDMILVHWPAHDQFLGEPLEVNPAACDRLGYSREELLMAETPILPPEERLRMVDIRKSVFENKKWRFTVSLVAKNGQVIPFEFHSRYFDTEGQPVIVSVAREVTVKEPAQISGAQLAQAFDQHEIWNEKEALWRVDQDLELFAELVEVFFQAQMDTVEKLREALGDEDFETVTKLAHSYKGSAGNLSATRLQKMSEYMEKCGRTRQPRDITALVPYLEIETDRFRELMVKRGFLNGTT